MIKIVRNKQNSVGTWGELIWGDFECYTFEPEGEDTIARGKDRRIPAGVYNIKWHWSGLFKKNMPNVFNENVPADRYILIHPGNFPDDTLGCILLGKTLCDKGVLNSKIVFNPFYEKLKSVSVDSNKVLSEKLEIVNNF